MKISALQKNYFTERLMTWCQTTNQRSLPWKQEKDPYKIWLSEIILQQTRAQQGLPYYLQFTEVYPTIQDMANASDEQVFRLWQGLGYYNRCKNMLITARHIVKECNGIFPDTYQELLNLKGIGPYTAAAIASFAFGRQHAVVDGNVYRVLSRYFGIDTPFDTNEGKKEFFHLAQQLLYKKDSAAYNQAIMDLGATVCAPAVAVCDKCPLQSRCVAFQRNMVACLPVKSKKQSVRRRYFHYIILKYQDRVWLHKRLGKDIWQNLYQPYLIEAETVLDTQTVHTGILKDLELSECKLEYEGTSKQKLTHQLIETHFFTVQLNKLVKLPAEDGKWIAINELKKVALPKTLVSFLEKKLYF